MCVFESHIKKMVRKVAEKPLKRIFYRELFLIAGEIYTATKDKQSKVSSTFSKVVRVKGRRAP